MPISDIRHRLRQDFQLALLVLMAIVALSAITPFAVYRLFRAEWFNLLMDSLLIAAILSMALYAWLSGNTRRACQALMYFGFILSIVGLPLLGPTFLPWVYPMLVANFFLTTPRQAGIASLLFMGWILMDRQLFPSLFDSLTFVATALLVCAYTYVFAYRSELQRQQLENLASRDTLTGIFNRRMFQQELQRAYQAFHRESTHCGLLVLDIDHFKQVNDTWGHDIGDEILIRLACLIERSVRKTDRFFRLGGEEFVLMVYSTHLEALKVMANNLCAQVEQGMIYKGKPLTISIGGALLQLDEIPNAWFSRADAALYRAKNQGRNQAVIDERGN